MADLATPFGRATLALALLAVDPAGLGGLNIRARSGPVRDAFAAMFTALPLPLTRLHPAISDVALFGGLNLADTLAKGEIVRQQGLLAQKSALILTMAERCPPELGARLGRVLDQDQGHCILTLDEGAGPEENAPACLTERQAFAADLNDVPFGDVTGFGPEPEELEQARAGLPRVRITAKDIEQITGICMQLGIDSLRAPVFALRAARAHAALSGRDSVCAEDIETACALCLAHRATQVPAPDEAPAEPPEQPPSESEPQDNRPQDSLTLPDELVLQAIRALLPADLLDRIATRQALRATGSGAGAVKKGNRRGRPLPARAGRLGDGSRVDIVATLRAAAPWQNLRARQHPSAGLQIRASDLRQKRFEDKSDRLLIFTVDASGSAALARLAEAKGAVELLLAQAYARRDHVALVAFRGSAADILLPPTRSLVQTKRRLASLPGGGGTPLAAGLQAALGLADQSRRRGLTPMVALLTDGRANVALDGRADRTVAATDALLMAVALRRAGVQAVVIDIGNRAEPALRHLSDTMAALYLPLPRADARRLSNALSAVLDS